MNVITASNLRVPGPSPEFLHRLRVSLAGFAHPGSALTAGLMVENWEGPQAVHAIYSVSLKTIENGLEGVNAPMSLRFLAGHQNASTAAACWTSPEVAGLPAKIVSATVGPEPAAVLAMTAGLNDLTQVTADRTQHYELRVLRVPALFIETFWLKSMSVGTSDWMVPYAGVLNAQDDLKLPGGVTLKMNHAVTLADFMTTAQQSARDRMTLGVLTKR